MLRHALGGAVIFVFFAALYCSRIGLLPCLQARGTRDKGSKFKKGAMKCCKENKITALILMRGIYSFVDSRLIHLDLKKYIHYGPII